MEHLPLQVDLTEKEKAAFFRTFGTPDGKSVIQVLRRWTIDKVGMTGGGDGQMQSNFLFFTEGERNIVRKIERVVTAFSQNPPAAPKKRTRRTA